MTFNDLMLAVDDKNLRRKIEDAVAPLKELYDVAVQQAELYQNALQDAQDILGIKSEEIEKLKAALRFYANQSNYDSDGAPFSGPVRDFGNKAREILQELG